jgi:peroxiredoxin
MTVQQAIILIYRARRLPRLRLWVNWRALLKWVIIKITNFFYALTNVMTNPIYIDMKDKDHFQELFVVYHPFNVGSSAPDATLLDHEGNEVTLSHIWQKKTTALFFLRHFGCPNCRAEVADLRANRVKLAAANLNIVLIGVGNPEDANQFRSASFITFPILCDPSRRLYRQFELFKAAPLRELAPANMLLTIKRSRQYRGNPFSAMVGDETKKQLGGVFVINPKGIVQYSHRSLYQTDFPTVDDLLKALKLQGLG